MAEAGKKAGGWTETETIALLLAIIDQQGGGAVRWANLQVPEGRTVKACMHRMEKLRGEVKAGKIALSDAVPSTPRKETTKKGKGKGKAAEEAAADDEEPSPIKPAPTKKARASKVKKEPSSDEADSEPKINDKKRKSSTPAAGSAKKVSKANCGKKITPDAIPEDTAV